MAKGRRTECDCEGRGGCGEYRGKRMGGETYGESIEECSCITSLDSSVTGYSHQDLMQCFIQAPFLGGSSPPKHQNSPKNFRPRLP